MATSPSGESKPAHRPSRRQQLIESAVGVFARQGYVESSVEQIAEAAGVVPTAIYYHFGTKEELFHQCMQYAMDEFSDAVSVVRQAGEPAGPDTLRSVVKAGWDWWESHPEKSLLIGRYSQSATGQALELRAAWEQRHHTRAHDYLIGGGDTRTTRAAREQQAVNTLRVRALLDIILATEAASLPGGVLADYSSDELSEELADACVRLIAP